MQAQRHLIVFAILLLAGCSLYEEARIVDRTEVELKRAFVASPDVLLRNTYGGLEEGGDVALLKLGQQDCTALMQRFAPDQAVQPRTREYDTFKQLDLTPSVVYSASWTDNDGADTVYLLDKVSCVLYRQAHFE